MKKNNISIDYILFFLLLLTLIKDHTFNIGINISVGDIIVLIMLSRTFLVFLKIKKDAILAKFIKIYLVLLIYYSFIIFYSFFFLNNNYHEIFGRFRNLFIYALLFFSGFIFGSQKKDAHKYLNYIKYFFVISFVLGIVNLVKPIPFLLDPLIEEKRHYHMIVNQEIGMFSILVFIYSFLMYLFRQKRTINFLFIAMCLTAVVGSQNRSVFVSYILAFLLIGFFIIKTKTKLKLNYIKAIAFTLTLLIISFAILSQSKQWDYFKERYSKFIREVSGETDLTTYDVRVGRTIATIKRWFESPIIGLGWGSQGTEYNIYKSGQYITTYYGTPHNYFAVLLENTGIIGFIIMIYFFYTIFRYARPREKLKYKNIITHSLFSFFLICHAFNFVNVYMSHGSAAYISLSFFIWGLTVANYKISKVKK